MAKLDRGKFPGKSTRNKDRTSAGTIAKRALAADVVRLRADGLTYNQIVDRLSVDGQATITPARARQLVVEELDRYGAPPVEHLRREQLEQADRLFNRSFKIAFENGRDRVSAITAALKAQERIANLYGLDAPKQTEVKDTTPHVVTPATAEDVVAQLAEEARADLAKQGLQYDPATGAVVPLE